MGNKSKLSRIQRVLAALIADKHAKGTEIEGHAMGDPVLGLLGLLDSQLFQELLSSDEKPIVEKIKANLNTGKLWTDCIIKLLAVKSNIAPKAFDEEISKTVSQILQATRQQGMAIIPLKLNPSDELDGQSGGHGCALIIAFNEEDKTFEIALYDTSFETNYQFSIHTPEKKLIYPYTWKGLSLEKLDKINAIVSSMVKSIFSAYVQPGEVQQLSLSVTDSKKRILKNLFPQFSEVGGSPVDFNHEQQYQQKYLLFSQQKSGTCAVRSLFKAIKVAMHFQFQKHNPDASALLQTLVTKIKLSAWQMLAKDLAKEKDYHNFLKDIIEDLLVRLVKYDTPSWLKEKYIKHYEDFIKTDTVRTIEEEFSPKNETKKGSIRVINPKVNLGALDTSIDFYSEKNVDNIPLKEMVKKSINYVSQLNNNFDRTQYIEKILISYPLPIEEKQSQALYNGLGDNPKQIEDFYLDFSYLMLIYKNAIKNTQGNKELNSKQYITVLKAQIIAVAMSIENQKVYEQDTYLNPLYYNLLNIDLSYFDCHLASANYFEHQQLSQITSYYQKIKHILNSCLWGQSLDVEKLIYQSILGLVEKEKQQNATFNEDFKNIICKRDKLSEKINSNPEKLAVHKAGIIIEGKNHKYNSFLTKAKLFNSKFILQQLIADLVMPDNRFEFDDVALAPIASEDLYRKLYFGLYKPVIEFSSSGIDEEKLCLRRANKHLLSNYKTHLSEDEMVLRIINLSPFKEGEFATQKNQLTHINPIKDNKKINILGEELIRFRQLLNVCDSHTASFCRIYNTFLEKQNIQFLKKQEGKILFKHLLLAPNQIEKSLVEEIEKSDDRVSVVDLLTTVLDKGLGYLCTFKKELGGDTLWLFKQTFYQAKYALEALEHLKKSHLIQKHRVNDLFQKHLKFIDYAIEKIDAYPLEKETLKQELSYLKCMYEMLRIVHNKKDFSEKAHIKITIRKLVPVLNEDNKDPHDLYDICPLARQWFQYHYTQLFDKYREISQHEISCWINQRISPLRGKPRVSDLKFPLISISDSCSNYLFDCTTGRIIKSGLSFRKLPLKVIENNDVKSIIPQEKLEEGWESSDGKYFDLGGYQLYFDKRDSNPIIYRQIENKCYQAFCASECINSGLNEYNQIILPFMNGPENIIWVNLENIKECIVSKRGQTSLKYLKDNEVHYFIDNQSYKIDLSLLETKKTISSLGVSEEKKSQFIAYAIDAICQFENKKYIVPYINEKKEIVYYLERYDIRFVLSENEEMRLEGFSPLNENNWKWDLSTKSNNPLSNGLNLVSPNKKCVIHPISPFQNKATGPLMHQSKRRVGEPLLVHKKSQNENQMIELMVFLSDDLGNPLGKDAMSCLQLIHIYLGQRCYDKAFYFIDKIEKNFDVNQSKKSVNILESIFTDLAINNEMQDSKIASLKLRLVSVFCQQIPFAQLPKSIHCLIKEGYDNYLSRQKDVMAKYRLSQQQESILLNYLRKINSKEGKQIIQTESPQLIMQNLKDIEIIGEKLKGKINAKHLDYLTKDYRTEQKIPYQKQIRVSFGHIYISFFVKSDELIKALNWISEKEEIAEDSSLLSKLPCEIDEQCFYKKYHSMLLAVLEKPNSELSNLILSFIKKAIVYNSEFDENKPYSYYKIDKPSIFVSMCVIIYGASFLDENDKNHYKKADLYAGNYQDGFRDLISKINSLGIIIETRHFDSNKVYEKPLLTKSDKEVIACDFDKSNQSEYKSILTYPMDGLDFLSQRITLKKKTRFNYSQNALISLNESTELDSSQKINDDVNEMVGQFEVDANELTENFAKNLKEHDLARLKKSLSEKINFLTKNQSKLKNDIYDLLSFNATRNDNSKILFLATKKASYTIDEMIPLLVRQDYVNFSNLTSEELSNLKSYTFHYMLTSSELIFLNKVLTDCDKISELDNYFLKVKLIQNLLLKNPVSKPQDFHLAALQYFEKKIIFECQMDCYISLTQYEDLSNVPQSVVLQLLMGKGKTSIITPMMILENCINIKKDKLLCVFVPEALFNSQYAELKSIISPVTGQKLIKFRFSRDTLTQLIHKDLSGFDKYQDVIQYLKTQYYQFLYAFANKNIIFSTVNDFLSFKASFRSWSIDLAKLCDKAPPSYSTKHDEHKSLVECHQKIVSLFEASLELLKQNGYALVDEVDEQFHPKYALNYPEGDLEPIDKPYYQISNELILYLSQKQYGNQTILEFLFSNQPATFKSNLLDEIKVMVARDRSGPLAKIYDDIMDKQSHLSTYHIEKDIINYFKNESNFQYFESLSDEQVAQLTMMKALLDKYLPKTLINSQGLYQDYGVNHKPNASVSEQMLAIPWLYGIACEKRIHEDPLLQMCYTILISFQIGIPSSLVFDCLSNLHIAALKEAQTYEIPFNNTYAGMKFLKLTERDEFANRDFTLEDAKTLSHNKTIIHYVLDVSILPLISFQPKKQVHCADSFRSLFASTSGYSGTMVDNGQSMPQGISVDGKNIGTDGLTYRLLQELKTKVYPFHIDKKNDIQTFLANFFSQTINENAPNLRCIVDTAAFFCGQNHLQIAKEIALYIQSNPNLFSSEIHWVKYYDDETSLLYLLNISSHESIPFNNFAIDEQPSLSACFTYYDQSHHRGAHVDQMTDAFMLLTFSENTDRCYLFQGARRLRSLGSQQLAIIYDDQLIKSTGNPLTLDDIYQISAKNQSDDIDIQNFMAGFNKIRDLFQRHTEQKIEKSESYKNQLRQITEPLFIVENEQKIKSIYQALLKSQKTKDLLDHYAKVSMDNYHQLSNQCVKASSGDVCLMSNNDKILFENQIDLIIKKTLRYTHPSRFDLEHSKSSGYCQVESQSESQAELEQEIHQEQEKLSEVGEIILDTNLHQALKLWQKMANYSHQLGLSDLSLQKYFFKKYPNSLIFFDEELLISPNLYSIYQAKKSTDNELWGNHSVEAKLSFYFKTQKKLYVLLLTVEDLTDLDKTLSAQKRPDFWVEDPYTQHVVWGKKSVSLNDEYYKRLHDQVLFFNGDCHNIAKIGPSKWFTEKNKDEKLKFLEETILSVRPHRSDIELVQRAFVLDKAYAQIFSKAEYKPFTSRQYLNNKVDSRLSDEEKLQVKKLARIFEWIDRVSLNYNGVLSLPFILKAFDNIDKAFIKQEPQLFFINELLQQKKMLTEVLNQTFDLTLNNKFSISALSHYHRLTKKGQQQVSVVYNSLQNYFPSNFSILPKFMKSKLMGYYEVCQKLDCIPLKMSQYLAQKKLTSSIVIQNQPYVIEAKNRVASANAINRAYKKHQFRSWVNNDLSKFISVIKKERCITKIQARHKMVKSRNQYLNFKQSLISLQSHLRRNIAVRHYIKTYQAIVKVQSAVRRYTDLNVYQKQKRASLKIQTCFRMTAKRRKFIKLKDKISYTQLIIKANNSSRKYLAKNQKSIVLQAFIRQKQAQKFYHNSCKNIIRIQSLVRKKVHHSCFNQFKKALITMQSQFRMRQVRKDCLRKSLAAIKLQAIIRRHIVIRRLFVARLTEKINDFLTIKIHSFFGSKNKHLIKDYAKSDSYSEKTINDALLKLKMNHKEIYSSALEEVLKKLLESRNQSWLSHFSRNREQKIEKVLNALNTIDWSLDCPIKSALDDKESPLYVALNTFTGPLKRTLSYGHFFSKQTRSLIYMQTAIEQIPLSAQI